LLSRVKDNRGRSTEEETVIVYIEVWGRIFLRLEKPGGKAKNKQVKHFHSEIVGGGMKGGLRHREASRPRLSATLNRKKSTLDFEAFGNQSKFNLTMGS